MERYYQPEIECAPVDQLKALQNERLVKQVRHVWENVPYYRKKMEAKGITPDWELTPQVVIDLDLQRANVCKVIENLLVHYKKSIAQDVDFDVNSDINLWDSEIVHLSDARLKKNIEPTQVTALNVLSQIEMKSFDWIESDNHCDIGMIAQQLREVEPNLVSENKATGVLSIKTTALIPYLVKAVQELQAKVDGDLGVSHLWVDTYSEEDKQALISSYKPQPKRATRSVTATECHEPFRKEKK